jgi:glycosyltransferase involved in cell wall biosynthesis
MKRRIVVSGVNLTEMGPVAVFKDALASLAACYGDQFEITALVHRREMFDIPKVTYREYPEIKSSWLKRIRFEFQTSNSICKQIKPCVWLSMDNITPNIQAQVQAVYCHNPSPFYKFSFNDLWLDWKFGLFTLFFKYLYAVNIRKNNYVIVQQDWIRQRFQSSYGADTVIVAHPTVTIPSEAIPQDPHPPARSFRFFYPAHPRTFKNLETALEAAASLEQNGFNNFELWLTVEGTETRYAAAIKRKYGHLASVRWLGRLPRQQIFDVFQQVDCLLFPSKLETWGLPITEFKNTGKPMLVADLPYAHETVGSYGRVCFFPPTSVAALAELMRSAVDGETVFYEVAAKPIAPPFASNWEELWSLVLV